MPENESSLENTETAPSNSHSRSSQKHLNLIQNILSSIDVLTFLEIAACYYSDGGLTPIFILRILVQTFFLSAKPSGLPDPAPTPLRSQLGILLGSNLLAITTHLIRDNPRGGEIERGYLHGGLLIDFVGEIGPISRWRLFSLDVLILALQVIMLLANIERLRMKDPGASGLPPRIRQDYNAEELGLRRSTERTRDTLEESAEGIELRTLLSEPEDEYRAQVHSLDKYNSGEFVVFKLDIMKEIKGLMSAREAGSSSNIDTDRVRALLNSTLTRRFGPQSTT